MSNVENWHRRHALTLASQLPDNANDALLVIEATREIVEQFLMPKEVTPFPENVLALRK
jgi:hypothetical protein